MRGPKGLLLWGGIPLVEYQVNALLDAGVSKVVVVLGHNAGVLCSFVKPVDQVKTVINLQYRTGRSSSVRAGLRHVPESAKSIMVIGVDQPRSSKVLRQVIDTHLESGSRITYPVYAGRGGHPVIFDAALLPELMRIRESRHGLREVLQLRHSEALEIEMDDDEVLLDLNLPEDYSRAIQGKNWDS